MKKFYQTPAMQVVKLQAATMIASSMKGVNSGDAGIGYGGGDSNYSGGARSQGFGGFLEDDTETDTEE